MDIETIKRLHSVLDDITLGNNNLAFDELGKIINEQYLTLTDVVERLPNYKETKIEMVKQLNKLNKDFGLNSLTRQEKNTYKSGFIKCYLFMKGKR